MTSKTPDPPAPKRAQPKKPAAPKKAAATKKPAVAKKPAGKRPPGKAMSKGLAVRAARAAAEKQGRDIRVLDVAEQIQITDHFVLASGATDRQVRAIGDAIEEELRAAGVKPLRREGEGELRWLLLDFGDIVVHVFQEQDRVYYELERLWKDAPEVRWQPAAPRARAPRAAASPQR